MWKYNKFNIGDLLGHKKALDLKFEVKDILCNEPEKEGEYLYCCTLINWSDRQTPPTSWMTAEELTELINTGKQDIHKYREDDLYLIQPARLIRLN